MLPRLISTNIPGLDPMLGGGLLAGSVVLIESDKVPEADLI